MSETLRVAWFTYFPIEWLDGLPDELASLPRMHPATWQRVLFDELQKEPNLELHIVVLRKQFPRSMTFQRGNATFHCIRVPGGLRAPSLFWLDTWHVSRVLKSVRPHVVHAWGMENGAGLIAARLRYPSVVTMQGLLNWILELGLGNRYLRFVARLEKHALRRLKHVTAESSFAIRYLRERYPNLDLHQVEHAPNWSFHKAPRNPQLKPLRLITVGTLGHPKGTDVLLKALDSLCVDWDFRLTLIGGAPPQVLEDYRRSVSPELWSRIDFKNYLTSAQVAEQLSEAALMVYPTRADNSPNAVKEAVAAGVPVVASAIGGIVDYVIPERNGFLFTAGDVDGCRNALLSALRHPQLGQGRVPEEALAQGRDYLSPSTMARRFLALYRKVGGSEAR